MSKSLSVKRELARFVRRLSRVWPKILSLIYYPLVFRGFGQGTLIERPTLLAFPDCISIGARTHIRRGVRLEAVLREGRQDPRIEIGAHVLIEQNVQIIAATRVVLEDNVTIAGQCAIVDVTHPYTFGHERNIGLRIADDDLEVRIGAGSFVGFGAVILPACILAQAVLWVPMQS